LEIKDGEFGVVVKAKGSWEEEDDQEEILKGIEKDGEEEGKAGGGERAQNSWDAEEDQVASVLQWFAVCCSMGCRRRLG